MMNQRQREWVWDDIKIEKEKQQATYNSNASSFLPVTTSQQTVQAQTERDILMRPTERWHLGREEMELIREERDRECEVRPWIDFMT